jgi:hypothetical protein
LFLSDILGKNPGDNTPPLPPSQLLFSLQSIIVWPGQV